RPARPLWLQYLAHFENPLVLVLLGASVVNAVTGELAGSSIVIALVIASVTVDFVQEVRAGRVAEKLRATVAIRARVIRDGRSRVRVRPASGNALRDHRSDDRGLSGGGRGGEAVVLRPSCGPYQPRRNLVMAIRIGINGFGRIGRLVYRVAMERGLEVAAVNDVVPADNLAYLLRHDTMQGRFRLDGKPAEVVATGDGFTVDGRGTRVLSVRDPAELPWKSWGVDYVLESTGLFSTFEAASGHLKAGAKRVVISAPTKSDPAQVPTVCLGVNDATYDPARHTVISNASCTTNCLAPVAKVIHDSFGLEEGLMTTVHSVTATQPTQDGPSKKDWRGGRNAYLNIIPSSTGAAKAVTLCIPALKGRLTGTAFRVPTATVSVVDLTFRSTRAASLAEINAAMQEAAGGTMAGILGYTDEEVVSSDFIGDRRSSIFDAAAGLELNPRFFNVVGLYANQAGD